MKKPKSIVSKRREDILDYLKFENEISTNELAEKLQISPLTLRRDMQALEAEGLIKRFYGGAKLVTSSLNSMDSSENKSITDNYSDHKKNIIAKYAASLINDGDTIFLNSSSTALMILKYLGNKRVYVVTNNGKALNVPLSPNIELVLTGGQVYERKQSLVGEFATYILSRVTANKCFLGVSGITSDSGITTSVLEETLINHEMIRRCSGFVCVLADSSKVGKRHNFSSGDISEITHLITDAGVSADEIKNFNAKNINVVALDDSFID